MFLVHEVPKEQEPSAQTGASAVEEELLDMLATSYNFHKLAT